MDSEEGSFAITQGSTSIFNASTRGRNAWIGRGDGHKVHYGAVANLVLPVGTLRAGLRYCVVASAGCLRSSPFGVPWKGLGGEDWCFEATEAGPPKYDSVIPTRTSPALYSHIEPIVQALHTTEKSIQETYTFLSTFYNRFFASQSGLASHKWLAAEYEAVAARHPELRVEITSFQHQWVMPSLIVRIPTARADSSTAMSDEVVILGAHLDSINRQNWTMNLQSGRAPGANDDGTGIAVVLEIYKLLLEHLPQLPTNGRTIELHAYSAEEEGMYGSADIAAEYQRRGVKVAAMLMLDQCGYVADPEHPVIGVFTDNTDVAVTSLLKQLVTTYSSTPFVVSNEVVNGERMADSDFHSFHTNGYRVGYIAEGPVDDIVYGNSKHTAFDLPAGVNNSHAVQIGGAATAFVLEMVLTQV